MIGMDRETGRTIDGWAQFVSRATQVLTTPVGGREHRRRFGCRVPELLGRLTSDEVLILAQSRGIAAFYEPLNGLSDFTPTRCLARRHATGLRLVFEGRWVGRRVSFEVDV
ncbi:hypothetical protein K4A83_11195 [Spirulina subsalsa FACHB-351]|uniref:Phage baseplate protein n=1 Tax=Spirulina subsalsa FACHB-351 TaxID=234711 RepID=A0ABT3L5Q6_9CYAN|nr:hypothetical protein [Spirulina subsalsa]MCW6036823.1 hypothetical protein [Spirulina subsalsa FACHB-351]